MGKKLKYAYFPGCSLHATAVDFGLSTSEVVNSLGVELVEVEDWICCGATPAHATSRLLSVAMPVKTLIDAKTINNQLVTCCAACYSRFKFANKSIQESTDIAKNVKKILGKTYKGDVKVRHLLDVLINDVGSEKIRKAMKNNLNGLKVASYYGCLLVRPPDVTEFDDPENPMLMDKLITMLGGEAIDWPYKNECCGASFALTNQEIVFKLAGDILMDARQREVDCIAVACPFCQANLDMREEKISKKLGMNLNIPVLYFTQLLGLMLGIESKKLGVGKQMVSSKDIFMEKGIAV